MCAEEEQIAYGQLGGAAVDGGGVLGGDGAHLQLATVPCEQRALERIDARERLQLRARLAPALIHIHVLCTFDRPVQGSLHTGTQPSAM